MNDDPYPTTTDIAIKAVFIIILAAALAVIGDILGAPTAVIIGVCGGAVGTLAVT